MRVFAQAGAKRIDEYWRAPQAPIDHFGLVAEEPSGRIVGHAAYIRLYGPRAELAIDLAEDVDRPALAAQLIARLGQVARANGILRFVATGPLSYSELPAVLFGGLGVTGGAPGAVIEFAIDAGEASLSSPAADLR